MIICFNQEGDARREIGGGRRTGSIAICTICSAPMCRRQAAVGAEHRGPAVGPCGLLHGQLGTQGSRYTQRATHLARKIKPYCRFLPLRFLFFLTTAMLALNLVLIGDAFVCGANVCGKR